MQKCEETSVSFFCVLFVPKKVLMLNIIIKHIIIIIICFRTLYVIHGCKKGNIPFTRCNSSFPTGEGDRCCCIGHYFGKFYLKVWYSPNLQDVVFFSILDDICVN